jgi:hypothetical protein
LLFLDSYYNADRRKTRHHQYHQATARRRQRAVVVRERSYGLGNRYGGVISTNARCRDEKQQIAKKDFEDAREEVTAVEKELKEAENRFKWGSRAL